MNNICYWTTMFAELLFQVRLKNGSFICERFPYGWRTAKYKHMLCSQGLWAEMNLYHTTPALTRNLRFSSLPWKTAPFSRLIRYARGCSRYILTPIDMCPFFSRILRHTCECWGPILTLILIGVLHKFKHYIYICLRFTLCYLRILYRTYF
jgi:hypothetical protein